MGKARTGVFVIFILAIAVGAADAATVTLRNGDRVTGELAGIDAGQLRLTTESLGDVSVPLASVARIEAADPVAVLLPSGERMVGRLEAGEDGQLRILTETGPFATPIHELLDLAAAKEGVRGDAVRAAIEVLEAEEKAEPKSPWTSELELGANLSRGNTDREGFNIAFSATRETEDDIFSAKALVLYAEEDGSRTVNEQHLRFREDIKFDPWYVFVLLSFERDEFEDLDLRAILSPGVGRVLADGEDFKAKVEVGPTLTYEDYRSGSSDYLFQLRIGFHAELKVFERAKLTEDLQIYPGFYDGGQLRIESDTGFENALSENLFFKLSIRNDYNTDTQPGVDKWDLKVLASLVYKF